MLRITAYADRLLAGLKDLDWPESTKRMQEAWIGRSEGAEVQFALEAAPLGSLTVFTTRPDTLFGCTYMVCRPSTRSCPRLTDAAQEAAVEAYRRAAATKSDLERTDLAKEKTGVFSGSYARNPVNGARVPVWIADYVLMGYGTGAIMAVPGQDQRDWDFATAFDLPILRTVRAAGRVRRRGLRGRRSGDRSANDEVSLNGLGDRGGGGAHHRMARRQGARPAQGELQASGLAVLAPALLGRTVPDRLGGTGRLRAAPARTRGPACRPSRSRSPRRAGPGSPSASRNPRFRFSCPRRPPTCRRATAKARSPT